MIFDNPPGTGDEPLTVLQMIPNLDAAIMVTTPSSVSEEDVIKCVGMTRMLNIENIGLVENMSYFECPHCEEKVNLFGDSKGEEFAKAMDVDYLGDLPFRTQVSESADKFLLSKPNQIPKRPKDSWILLKKSNPPISIKMNNHYSSTIFL